MDNKSITLYFKTIFSDLLDSETINLSVNKIVKPDSDQTLAEIQNQIYTDIIVSYEHSIYLLCKVLEQNMTKPEFEDVYKLKEHKEFYKEMMVKNNGETTIRYKELMVYTDNIFDNVEEAINYIFNFYRKKQDDSFEQTESENIESDITVVDSAESFSDANEKINETINKQIDKIYDALIFNPNSAKYKELSDKYKAMKEYIGRFQNEDGLECRIVKTILFAYTYLEREKNNEPYSFMNNIVNSKESWALGNGSSNSKTFYSDNKIIKAFSTYYAYMNNKHNPYYKIIDNEEYNYMDSEARKIYEYFSSFEGTNEVAKVFDSVNSIYYSLKTTKEIIDILDAPMDLNFSVESLINGYISGIFENVLGVIDIQSGMVARELFDAKIIPIDGIKYSVSDLYNYLMFISAIIKTSFSNESMQSVTQEEFMYATYDYLGVNKDTVAKCGYGAFSSYKNDYIKSVTDDEHLVMIDDEMFTTNKHMPIFYSLVQFAVQKEKYKTGNLNYENTFNYSNVYKIKDMLNDLSISEIYYVFDLYDYLNMYDFDSNFEELTEEHIIDKTKNKFTTSFVNHNNVSMYKDYLSYNHDGIVGEQVLKTNFSDSHYSDVINIMFSVYQDAVEYNKEGFKSLVYSNFNISDLDSFLFRVLPSINELMKLFGQDLSTAKHFTDLLDTICMFIGEVMFKKLYIGLKTSIKDLTQGLCDKLFESLNLEKPDGENTVQFNLGKTKVSIAIDKILRLIENGNFENVFGCFGSAGKINEFVKVVDLDKLEHERKNDDINIIYHPSNKDDDSKEEIIYNKEKDIEIIYNETNKELIDNITAPTKASDNIKIEYENGNINLIKKDLSSVTIIKKEDTYATKDIIIKDLSPDEHKQLLEIRDFIDNITNLTLLNLSKDLQKEQDRIETELLKNKPNYITIQESQKKITDLTEKVKYVKNENRIISNDNPILIKDFDIENGGDDLINYNKYFQKTLYQLEELENVAITNHLPLTNTQISNLIKV